MQGLAGHVGYQSRPTTQQLVAGFQLLGAIKFHSGNETRHSLCLCFLAVPGVFQTVFVCICGISINFHHLLFTRSPSFLKYPDDARHLVDSDDSSDESAKLMWRKLAIVLQLDRGML